MHAVIIDMHNYLLSTINIDPHVDANSDKQFESTFIFPKETNVTHTSSINPLQCIDDQNTLT